MVVFEPIYYALRTVDYNLRATLPVRDNIIGISVVLVAEELALAPVVALPFRIVVVIIAETLIRTSNNRQLRIYYIDYPGYRIVHTVFDTLIYGNRICVIRKDLIANSNSCMK